MALTNAEKQKRWRDKRNSLAETLTGKPKEIAEGILRQLGPEQAKKVIRALDKRLRNLNPDCPKCHGTGFFTGKMFHHCGAPMTGPNGQQMQTTWPCDDCGADAETRHVAAIESLRQ